MLFSVRWDGCKGAKEATHPQSIGVALIEISMRLP